jgi:NAD(P)-dependent dehydrogenase (short-subunit alcohol dehydrogenase family)
MVEERLGSEERVDEFAGRVAVVTGAAGGIGRALAVEAARRGMRVALADVDEKGLEETHRQVLAQGAEALARRTDVSREADVVALADAAERELGGTHLVFNNAGVLVGGCVWERTADDWRWVLGVNVWGVIHGVRVFVPRMLASGRPGHVVNTASVGGLLTGPFLSPYVVSKHAVVALTEALHYELGARKAAVGASVLCPGAVRTGIWRSERIRPADLAHKQELHGADERSFMEGMSAAIDAGIDASEIAPGVFDAVAARRFWILPDPSFLPLIQQRFDGILAGTNPGEPGVA